ncbi:hypothetical protein [Bradyrhizobium sp. CCBAU 11386]|uniref:hypothetical protein n=1 Tax=Bradyrhizobium sp. CCBAU 11386 TaxID=1630837 RepID=UPI002304063C|nr:hypothetical protein [Bradyrhizobium sp. CCBAU 11386]
MNLLGFAEYRDEGEKMLAAPGDVVVIQRGALRSLMRCPDGCGETLVVNLDPFVGSLGDWICGPTSQRSIRRFGETEDAVVIL